MRTVLFHGWYPHQGFRYEHGSQHSLQHASKWLCPDTSHYISAHALDPLFSSAFYLVSNYPCLHVGRVVWPSGILPPECCRSSATSLALNRVTWITRPWRWKSITLTMRIVQVEMAVQQTTSWWMWLIEAEQRMLSSSGVSPSYSFGWGMWGVLWGSCDVLLETFTFHVRIGLAPLESWWSTPLLGDSFHDEVQHKDVPRLLRPFLSCARDAAVANSPLASWTLVWIAVPDLSVEPYFQIVIARPSRPSMFKLELRSRLFPDYDPRFLPSLRMTRAWCSIPSLSSYLKF